MARPLRVEFPGATYHVMNRGLERRRTFLEQADYQRFLGLLKEVHNRWQVEIFAYCCMRNHFHLLLQTPRGNLSRVMRHVGGLYTQQFNRARGRDGPLFRGRYKAIVVDTDAYLLKLVRYIHFNPVEVGLVDDAGAYPWSSHHLYRLRSGPRWLTRNKVLAHFDSFQEFERFVAQGNDASLTAFYSRKRWSPFLGDREFVARVMKQAKFSSEHPRAQKTPQFPTIDAVLEFICDKMGVSADTVLNGGRGKQNLPRNLAVYIASRTAGFPHRDIRRFFHLGSDSAVAKICYRTGRVLLRNRRLRRFVQLPAGG